MPLPARGLAISCFALQLLSALQPVTASADAGTGADGGADKPPSKSPEPLWIQPSGEWYGIDGDWSNFAFFIGSPAQAVYLTPATALSEIWVVSTGGCVPVQLCIDARGGVFDISQSDTWRSLGTWLLGMNYTGMGGNGDYGLETLAFVNTVASFTTAIDDALVAVYNDTNYYQGYVGLGVTQGRFGNNLTMPFISQLAQSYGSIPSHSYGYTAGAYYRPNGKNRGTVASLTLGGYDKLRFVPHDHKFALDPVTRLPTVRLRGITAHVDSIEHAPTKNWTSTSHPLVTMDDSIIAIIDSSTPYLWLPTPVCERFAAALNLTWREDLGVYVFANGAQYTHYQNDESLKFTFTLSSYQNADDFGQPLSTPGVVNITLPSAAFAQLLRYPFRNVIKWGDSSIPYFPLKRSTKEVNNEQYIIGRVFMQEAYLITSYDRSSFSLHQALFPQNASSNYSLEAIPRPPDSPYPPYRNEPTSPSLKGGLNTAQKAGIALGILITLGLLSLFLYFRHQHKRPSKENKDTAGAESERTEVPAALQEEVPTSPVKRMFTKVVNKKRSRKTVTAGSDGSSGQPVEVGADAQHQVYEMPVPPEPVELDSNDVGDDITELGLDTTQGLSQYEITRRKLERQMRGPVPAYTPPENGMAINIQEKSAQDISPIPHYRPADEPSPASSPTYANSSTLPYSLPSPLTPHGEWTSRMTDLPSPMTIAPPTRFPGPSSEQEAGISLSPGPSPVTPRSVHFPPSMAPTPITCSGSNPAPTTPTSGTMPRLGPPVQRTPIDPSRVVCLGPLPENIQLQLPQQPVPRLRIPQSPLADLSSPGVGPSQSLGHYRSDTQGSTDTLGSNYTMEEAERLKELERQHGLIMARSSQVQEQGENSSRQRETGEQKMSEGQIEHRSASSDTRESRSPNSEERIETGFEIIHVPQMAEKRYSFEVGDDS